MAIKRIGNAHRPPQPHPLHVCRGKQWDSHTTMRNYEMRHLNGGLDNIGALICAGSILLCSNRLMQQHQSKHYLRWCDPAPTHTTGKLTCRVCGTSGLRKQKHKTRTEPLPQTYEASPGDRYASLLDVLRAFSCAFWVSARPNTAARWPCWGRCLRTHIRGVGSWCAGTPGGSHGTASGCLLQLVYALHRLTRLGHGRTARFALQAATAADAGMQVPFPL